MTKQREFKQRVRARMAKTGERYAAARMHLLGAEPGTDAPRPGMRGIWPGYPRCGGLCGDTGAMRNVVEQRGIRSPHDGAPYSEAMLTGLCGGIGFLYAVFEYKGMPPLLSVMPRHDTMPDSFIAGGLDRLNATVTTSETGSAAVARR
ncbi:MAG: BtrH N-terminal domain-containing protein, partial [Phycisphaerales bacterium]|nr:BtrH N-terminal domain-containing protein [Phycisphaerales bacterium]